ncbi:hypothetical protein D3C85_1335340 [compost metagenome]
MLSWSVAVPLAIRVRSCDTKIGAIVVVSAEKIICVPIIDQLATGETRHRPNKKLTMRFDELLVDMDFLLVL